MKQLPLSLSSPKSAFPLTLSRSFRSLSCLAVAHHAILCAYFAHIDCYTTTNHSFCTLLPVPALPSIPIPAVISHFFSLFPLITYPAPCTSTPPPSVPTLWLIGPAPANSTESLDPTCRQAQALARFAHYNLQVRWLNNAAGAPGEQLPALHLSNGELLGSEEVLSRILGLDSKESKESTPDPTHQAYTSLLTTTLLPSVLSSLYLSPTPQPITPAQSLPYLTALASSFGTRQTRTARIAQIKQLRGGKQGSKIPLDLEAVEREAVAALGALEIKMRETEAEGEWFGGVQCVLNLVLLLLLYARLTSH